MQHMMVTQRIMYGSIAPTVQFFTPPPPTYPSNNVSPPPPPPSPQSSLESSQEGTMDEIEYVDMEDSDQPTMDVSSHNITYDSLSTNISFSSDYPPPPTLYENWHQNGQDMLEGFEEEMQINGVVLPLDRQTSTPLLPDDFLNETTEFDYNEMMEGLANLDDDEEDDDDVIFVDAYQRPDDISPIIQRPADILVMDLDVIVVEPAQEPMDHEIMEAAEARAAAAEERMRQLERIIQELTRSTSCPVCLNDLLTSETLLMRCGHLGCGTCLRALEEVVEDARCPTCRANFVSARNCNRVYFN